MSDAIDIVIPWVDGNDPEWLAEKNKYKKNKAEDDNINRYRDWDLLRYWFRGIEKNAPWINKIHFITWGHLPSWLDAENPKLNIVKHQDYIPEKYLPVFSSHPIEINMHRIKELSETFVYFNDDTYLIDGISPEFFFQNGLPVDTVKEVPLRFNVGGIDHIIGNDMMIVNKNFDKKAVIKKNRKKWFSPKALSATAKNLYMLPINGFSAFDNPHLPQPFLKSTIEKLWQKEYQILDETSNHKFRSNEDVNQWLFRYWQFCEGTFIQSGAERGRFFSIGRDDELIEAAISEKKMKLICLSDDDVSLDFEKEKYFLKEMFEKILPEKSSFEK